MDQGVEQGANIEQLNAKILALETVISGKAPKKKEDPAVEAAVKEQQAVKDAEALLKAKTAPIYFDGEKYWDRDNAERWFPLKSETIASNVRNRFKLKAQLVDEVLYHYRMENHVVGAFPIVLNKALKVETKAGPTLNISWRKVVEPADHDGPFPWIENFVNNVWDPKEPIQRDLFLTWWQRFYLSALEGKPVPGHAIFLAGETNVGKTFFSQNAIGGSVGGFVDAGTFLLGKTDFNKEAVECAYWAVDDSRSSSTWEKHDEFAERIKMFVANPSLNYHPKYRDATTVQWKGRIFITCNLDRKSLGLLPDLDGSIEDKVLFLRCRDNWRPPFKTAEEVVQQELPFFLRWLAKYQSPLPILDANKDARFGFAGWHHPELRIASREDSPSGQLDEMLTYTVKHAYVNDDKLSEKWMSATEVRVLLDNDGMRSALQKFAGNRLGHALSRLWDEVKDESETAQRASRVRGRKLLDGKHRYLINLEPEAS